MILYMTTDHSVNCYICWDEPGGLTHMQPLSVNKKLQQAIPFIQLSNHLVYVGIRHLASTPIGHTVCSSIEVRIWCLQLLILLHHLKLLYSERLTATFFSFLFFLSLHTLNTKMVPTTCNTLYNPGYKTCALIASVNRCWVFQLSDMQHAESTHWWDARQYLETTGLVSGTHLSRQDMLVHSMSRVAIGFSHSLFAYCRHRQIHKQAIMLQLWHIVCNGHKQVRLDAHIKGKMQTRFNRVWYADKRKHQRNKYQQIHAPAGSSACANVRTSWV